MFLPVKSAFEPSGPSGRIGAYPGFCSMKRLGVLLVHRRVTPSIKFAGTHLYTYVERGNVRIKCLAQEHNTMSTQPGLEPGPLAPEQESKALTMRPPCLPQLSIGEDCRPCRPCRLNTFFLTLDSLSLVLQFNTK